MNGIALTNKILNELQTVLSNGDIVSHRHPDQEPQDLQGRIKFCQIFNRTLKAGNSVLMAYTVARLNWDLN